MTSSVLGLGAAALGSASFGSKAKEKMVNTPMPSYKDYLSGYMNTMLGDVEKPRKAANALLETGSVLGAKGQFYYGSAPEKTPKGSLVLRGPDISYQTTDKSGSAHATMPTYQVVNLNKLISQATAQSTPQAPASTETPQLTLDLTQGGKKNVLNRADIKYAKEQGATGQEIRQAVESQDIRMSARAKARLYKENKDKK